MGGACCAALEDIGGIAASACRGAKAEGGSTIAIFGDEEDVGGGLKELPCCSERDEVGGGLNEPIWLCDMEDVGGGMKALPCCIAV
mmetsp:Transcript_14782/g.46530  ORF Transcript_14782/g.46530 Transcript_14782/m.46530 type:complete len:86 (+) Transcript_14782:543-800(+)